MKTILLVAVTLATRISELEALCTNSNFCIFHEDKGCVHMDPAFHPKISLEYHREQEINFPSFCPDPEHPKEIVWHMLDMRRPLITFLNRTHYFSWSESHFVNITPPNLGQKMSAPTMSSIKFFISEAYKAFKIEVPKSITADSETQYLIQHSPEIHQNNKSVEPWYGIEII